MSIEARNILNPNVGLQDVLDPAGFEFHLPQARPLATSVSAETGLADLYRLSDFQSRILAGLQPEVGDETLLRPDVFGKNLRESHRRLKDSKNPRVRRFLRDELGPLLENDTLLREYVNLLVSA
ncbi:MAG: type III secretion protein [Candidatus Accumulibacter sp.]|jgi:type III secretion protein X|nr:type III secretion protein [Accumulibacter sp.]